MWRSTRGREYTREGVSTEGGRGYRRGNYTREGIRNGGSEYRREQEARAILFFAIMFRASSCDRPCAADSQLWPVGGGASAASSSSHHVGRRLGPPPEAVAITECAA